jgi:hypothetical protein
MDIANLLNRKMRSNPLWKSLAEAVEDLINTTVGTANDQAMNAISNPYRYLRGDVVDPRGFTDIAAVSENGGMTLPQMIADRERVANVRVVLPDDDNGGAQLYMDLDGTTYAASANRFHDRPLLVQEAKHLGFDFFSDDLSDADYARVILFINQYWPKSGSKDELAKFLGFIRDIRIDLVQLWTVDDGLTEYDVLERKQDNMTPIWNGGKYYPTFHYDMYYDAFADTNIEELQRLFYALAPIHLVLRRMIETVRSRGLAYAAAVPLTGMIEGIIWRPQKATQSQNIKYRFTAAVVNKPMLLVPPNLNPNGVTISAMGPHGVWILERDPTIADPSDPVGYVKNHGLYIAPSDDPEDSFSFPPNGIWDGGIWFLAEVPTTGVSVQIT